MVSSLQVIQDFRSILKHLRKLPSSKYVPPTSHMTMELKVKEMVLSMNFQLIFVSDENVFDSIVKENSNKMKRNFSIYVKMLIVMSKWL